MSTQLTSHVLMIRPVNFGFNEETAVNNHYQIENDSLDQQEIQKLALQEFDELADKLQAAGISVTIFEDTPYPPTPDSIFPNNWVSFHGDGRTVLYPMFAKNRRTERRPDILNSLGRNTTQVLDITEYESDNCFLEGTGSMVLDRVNKIAYACISERTDQDLLQDWADQMGYSACHFRSTQIVDEVESPIYHTNVMMSVGEDITILCSEVIRDNEERAQVLTSLKISGHSVIEISENQVNHFAGNMLQLTNENGEHFMVMSTQAFETLTPNQVTLIETNASILHSPLNTIEKLGGGSARCMLAEVF